MLPCSSLVIAVGIHHRPGVALTCCPACPLAWDPELPEGVDAKHKPGCSVQCVHPTLTTNLLNVRCMMRKCLSSCGWYGACS